MMGVPSNAMWFRWQGRDSRDYGLVLTDLPHIITPSRNVEEVFVSNASKMPMLYNGYNPYDIQLSIAYIGTTVNNTEVYWDEHTFIEKMGEFFYREPASYNMLNRAKNKLVLSTQLPYYMTAEFVSGIDLQNLYKYRTSTIQFHCQPFRRELYKQPGSTTYSDTDLFFDRGLVFGSTITNTSYPSTKCDDVNRRPKIVVLLPNFKSAFSDVKYLRVWYNGNPTDDTKQMMKSYQPYCIGRQLVIDMDGVCNAIHTSLSTLSHSLMVEIDYDADKYIVEYEYTEDDVDYFGYLNISKYINTQVSYTSGSNSLTPQDNMCVAQGLFTRDYNLYNTNYNPNKRLQVGNNSSTKPEFVIIEGYSSSITRVHQGETFGTLYFYPLANII